jgi:hypothetical protein
MANQPFKVHGYDFPTNSMRAFFNTKNCFAQGNYAVIAGGHIALDGDCRIVQFGINPQQGKHCMFVLDGNVSHSDPNPMMVAMSFQFDDMGRVDDVRFGNGSWMQIANAINLPNGTHASFGFLSLKPRAYNELNTEEKAKVDAIDGRLQTEGSTLTKRDIEELQLAKKNIMNPPPTWGCTRVLKGSFDFVGCEHHTMPGNRSFRVPCVQASRNLDETETYARTSDETYARTSVFFEHKFGGVSRYGANRFPIGFFVYSKPYSKPGTIAATSDLPQEHILKMETKLKECEASLQMDRLALRWLALHPLMFPTGDITQTFVNDAFEWVNELSMQFKKPYVSAVHPMYSGRTPQALAPGFAKVALAKMLSHPPGSEGLKEIMPCKCTQTTHDPICKNRICPWYVAFESGRFVWPSFEFHPNPDQDDLIETKKKQIKEGQIQKQRNLDAETARMAEREASVEAARAAAKSEKAAVAAAARAAAKLEKEKEKASAAQASAAQASAAQASAAQASAAQASAAQAQASAAPGTSSRPRRLTANAAAVVAAAVVAPASKRASSNSASAAKRSKQGGTRRRRRRRSIRR